MQLFFALEDAVQRIEAAEFKYDERLFMHSMGCLTEFVRDRSLYIADLVRSDLDPDVFNSNYDVVLGYCNLYQQKLGAQAAMAMSLRMRYGSS